MIQAQGKPLTDQLCLVCGLCCNGALFRDVELQAGDDPAKLTALGLVLNGPPSRPPGSQETAPRSPTVAAPCLAEPSRDRQGAVGLMGRPHTSQDGGTSPRPHPLTPSLSPSGGEGARRAGEGKEERFMGGGQVVRDHGASPEPNLPAGTTSGRLKIPQPCAALQPDGSCRIYADRPKRCCDFDCALLKSVAAGQCALPAALGTIRTARARADRVRLLLRELEDGAEHLALSRRFQRLHRRFARARLDEDTASTFSQLTLAVHDLNLVLRDAFYT